MKFVAIKTVDQLDLQALHRIRERLVCQRTSVINQNRAFLLERGIAVRQGLRALRTEMPIVLAMTDKLSPRMIHMIETLCTDWRHLDGRIETVSDEIKTLSEQDDGAKRLMTVPGIGPIISTATVAAIGSGDVFSKGRDFGAWLGTTGAEFMKRYDVPLDVDKVAAAIVAGLRGDVETGVTAIGVTGKGVEPIA